MLCLNGFVVPPGHGRAEPGAQVQLVESVLVGIVVDVIEPILGEVAARQVQAAFFQRLQPDELDLEIVVRRAAFRDFLNIE